jgi:hypothetical protein
LPNKPSGRRVHCVQLVTKKHFYFDADQEATFFSGKIEQTNDYVDDIADKFEDLVRWMNGRSFESDAASN